jgi:hypothetical protein
LLAIRRLSLLIEVNMAVIRTVLPRKGFVQSQHGLTQYESDQDSNWLLLDSNIAFISDLYFAALGVNGLVNGFTLGTSSSLIPSITAGMLFAQGSRYAPALAPGLGPAPAATTSYLFYNSATGFYYQVSPVAANAGDALIGQIVTNATAVTAVTPGAKIFGQLAVSAPGAGNFAVQHLLGRAPLGAVIQMTSNGTIYFQTTMYDATNVYLASSTGGLTANVLIW